LLSPFRYPFFQFGPFLSPRQPPQRVESFAQQGFIIFPHSSRLRFLQHVGGTVCVANVKLRRMACASRTPPPSGRKLSLCSVSGFAASLLLPLCCFFCLRFVVRQTNAAFSPSPHCFTFLPSDRQFRRRLLAGCEDIFDRLGFFPASAIFTPPWKVLDSFESFFP